MMASPDEFALDLEGKSYQELRKGREELVKAVESFERERLEHAEEGCALPGEMHIDPGPDVQYQMNLEYLAQVCEMLSEQFNREFEQ